MPDLVVACYLWSDPEWPHMEGFQYGPDDARLLQRMVARNLSVPHEFACITDRPELFDNDEDIRGIQIDWTKHVPGTCFVRLMTFHPYAGYLIGKRILTIDLDAVVVGNMNVLVERNEPIVMWRNPTRLPWDNPVNKGRPFYNTSLVLVNAGAVPEAWETFDPKNRIDRDDQWWLSRGLGPDMPHWSGKDGVYRLAREDTPGSGVEGDLPDNARIVFFPGSTIQPGAPHVIEKYPWITAHRY